MGIKQLSEETLGDSNIKHIRVPASGRLSLIPDILKEFVFRRSFLLPDMYQNAVLTEEEAGEKVPPLTA